MMLRWLKRLREWWREALLVGLYVLPAASLAIFGMLWLWERDAVLTWLGTILIGVAIVAAIVRFRPRVGIGGKMHLTDTTASVSESNARKAIDELSREATADDVSSPIAAQTLAMRVVNAVARAYNPDAVFPSASVTIPELLLLTERLARDLRRTLLDEIPTLRDIRISLALTLSESRGMIMDVISIYRAGRLLFNAGTPVSAILQEALSLTFKSLVSGPLQELVKRQIAGAFARKVGESAILLYSGQLKKDAAELLSSASDDASRALASEAPPGPITILLVGQINSGKSTLLNALSKRTRALSSPLPATKDFEAYLATSDAIGEVRLMDGPGLGVEPHPNLVDQASQADLIVWVAAAHRADRAPDTRARRQLQAAFDATLHRRQPPILLVMTHADRLTPASEWAPPYDFVRGGRPKEIAIRNALSAARTALWLSEGQSVPVSILESSEAWNLDAVWTAIARQAPAASQRRMERLAANRGFLDVAADLGRAIPGAISTAAKILKK